MNDAVVITSDLDWAPDYAIDATAALLAAANVPVTWFVTHASPAVARLRGAAAFELGIHPNFLPGSSHGATPEEVLRSCLGLVPGAVSMRTHSLVQSTPIFRLVAAATTIRFDVSLLLPGMGGLAPFEQRFGGKPLTRVPFVWEDDFAMDDPRPRWDAAHILALPGLRVIDVHPIHVYLNSADMRGYEELKKSGLQTTPESGARPFINHGEGTRTFLESFLRAAPRERMACIRDLGSAN